MSDLASFNDADVMLVFGVSPQCILTHSNQGVEKHHILGRGFDFGIRPDDERRIWFSSIYNCAPIIHSFHHGGYRDHRYMRMMLLEIVEEMVRASGYEKKAHDIAYLQFRNEWLGQFT